MRSTVIFVEKSAPATITELHDILSNDLISVKEKWSFEFKTFRLTVKNLPPESPRLMHSITFSHRDNKSVIVKNKSAIVTSAMPGSIPAALTLNGCSSASCESFDHLLTSKLSNLWTQRQTIKGDFGSTYQTSELTIRATNVFSYGGFKGLLIELECEEQIPDSEFDQRINRIRNYLRDMSIEDYKICSDIMDPQRRNFLCDLAQQYVKVLEL
ncbi:LANO_0H10374g1_1 [Lachancea nothofagi CBS 11611]|uniref:Mediator of RNA polymerase II transcription subunit 20 n=1 Tax=Lachancea nothofagi CBS 11611 TaxID=1266666 RepID=A0A1G4KLZ8_9SACH|nr:LANO_0H10374g1_1 [Lachancea nothofagi CBS 11611]